MSQFAPTCPIQTGFQRAVSLHLLVKYGNIRQTNEELRHQLRNLTLRPQVSKCGAFPLSHIATHNHLSGYVTCKAYGVCPVCTLRIGFHYRKRIEALIEDARVAGQVGYMVTVRPRHNSSLSLLENLKASKAAWQKSAKELRRKLKQKGFDLSIASFVEFTFKQNEWEGHMHALLFTPKFAGMEKFLDVMIQSYVDKCVEGGLRGTSPFYQHKTPIDMNTGKELGRYLTKQAFVRPLSVVEKQHDEGGSLHQFELLALAVQTRREHLVGSWRYFEKEVKGHQKVTFPRELHQKD